MTPLQRTLSVAIPAASAAGYGLYASLSDPLPSWLAEPWVPYLAGLSLFLLVVAAVAWTVALPILLWRVAKWIWTGPATVRQAAPAPSAPVLTIGDVEVAQFQTGGEFLLPLKIGPKQQADCRVVLTVNRVDGEKIPATSFVLETDQAIEDGDKRTGRVRLDEDFKRFEIISCCADRDTFLIQAQAGDCWIPRGSYMLSVTVAGAGPSQTRDFVLQDDGDAVQISSDGFDRKARKLLLHSSSQQPAP